MEKGTAWTFINLFVVGAVLPEADSIRRTGTPPCGRTPTFLRMIVSRENQAEDGLRPEDYELEQCR